MLAAMPEVRRATLRGFLEGPRGGRPARLLGVHDGLSATLAEAAQESWRTFDGLWIGSYSQSASAGIPDVGLVTLDARLALVNEVLSVTTLPLVVDGEAPDGPDQLQRLVQALDRLGVSAMVIEDQGYPKRSSLYRDVTHHLRPPDVFAELLRAAVASRGSADFLVLARIESLIAGLSVDDALARAEIYLRAGAEGIVIHSASHSAASVVEFATRFRREFPAYSRGPFLMAIPTTYGTISSNELGLLGIDMTVYANQLLRGAFKQMTAVMRALLLEDRAEAANDLIARVDDVSAHVRRGFTDPRTRGTSS
jgi:phosphoenolpyruvate phosphomutase